MHHRIGGAALIGYLGLAVAFARGAPGVTSDGQALAALLLGRAATEAECRSPHALWAAVEAHDEVLADWLRQDLAPLAGPELLGSADGLTRFLSAAAAVCGQKAGPAACETALAAYRAACAQRRARRLARVKAEFPRLVYARHFVMGGSHYAYTEALSDAQAERNFRAGGQLCLAEWRDALWHETVLTETKEGVIRDADVDYDGRAILFALKRSDRDGRNILRLTFDQVHLNYPSVAPDVRVLYTRWEYNDRSQMYPQPLFQMQPDGTAQSAVYGENSWFPTTIIHARGIPGSGKIFAIATGHHSRQPGELILIDPARGRQEAEGITRVRRPARASWTMPGRRAPSMCRTSTKARPWTVWRAARSRPCVSSASTIAPRASAVTATADRAAAR